MVEAMSKPLSMSHKIRLRFNLGPIRAQLSANLPQLGPMLDPQKPPSWHKWAPVGPKMASYGARKLFSNELSKKALQKRGPSNPDKPWLIPPNMAGSLDLTGQMRQRDSLGQKHPIALEAHGVYIRPRVERRFVIFFDVSFRFTVFRFERCFVFVLNGPNCTMAF